jgi:hypothetical membrane protein
MILGTDNKKKAGVLLFVGGAQFTVFLTVAEAVFPNYSVSTNYISDLGVWSKPSAAIFNPSVFFFGLLLLASGYYLQKEFRKRGFSSIVALAGLGALGVGIFPEDTFLVNGVPAIHGLFALFAFLFGGLAAIASYKVTKAPFRYFSVILGVAALLALGLFGSTQSYDYVGLGVGGMERMIVYPTLVWAVCLGGYLMADSDKK